MISIEKL